MPRRQGRLPRILQRLPCREVLHGRHELDGLTRGHVPRDDGRQFLGELHPVLSGHSFVRHGEDGVVYMRRLPRDNVQLQGRGLLHDVHSGLVLPGLVAHPVPV